MAGEDFADFTENSIQLFNKYFILPVLTLNASVTNLDSNVTTFTNLSSVIANASSIAILNTSTLANTSSITNINVSILENISSIATLNTSLTNAINTVNSTTLTIGGTNGTSTQSYAGALTSGTLNIATANTSGNINIGSATASNQVNIGGVLIGANAINTGADTNFQIASTNITSSINIASNQIIGVLNIGTNSSRTASINIGNTTSLSKINIETANTGNTDADPCIKIGTAGASAKLIKIGSSNAGANNTINLGISELISSSGGIELNGISGTTTNLYIGNKQTSGILHLGSFTGVRTGSINVAAVTGSTCPINILNGGGATTGGSVNIANGTLQTTTVNIASGTGTGTVTIGNSANTVNINGNVTLGRPLTLPTTYVLPTSGQLGYVFTSTQSSTTSITTSQTVGTVSISTPGTYLVSFAVQLELAAGASGIFSYVSINNQSYGTGGLYGQAAPYYQSIQGSYAVTTSGSYSAPITIVVNPAQLTSVTRLYSNHNYVRIA